MNPVRIGVLTVKGPSYHPTARLREAASARGAEVVVVNPYRHPPGFAGNRARLVGPLAGERIDALLPRQGAEIKTAPLALIAHFERSGVPVINGLRAILTVRHKFLAMQAFVAAGLGVPDTIYAGDARAYAEATARRGPGPVVVKPIRGRQGSGIALLKPGQRLPVGLAAELEKGNGVLVQTFIDPATRRDLRVLVVGGEVAGAMVLTPEAGEFRANFHLGARGRAVAPSPEIADAARKAAGAVGLEIAGVDLMRLEDGTILVLEANYAPGFRGLEEATGMDVAGRIIDYVLSRRRPAGGKSPQP
jgi:ribosomal protein S6--L-glutamate ligase